MEKEQQRIDQRTTGHGNSNGGEQEESIESVPLYRKKGVLVVFGVLVVAVIAAWYWYLSLRAYQTTDDAYIDGDRVAISAKILGRIDQLTVDEGDSVRQGEVLVRLDASDLQAQQKQAEASLVFAQQSVTLARVNMEKSQEDFGRAQKQYSGAVIPKEQFDHARSAYDAARAEYAIAQSRVATAKAQLDVIATQLRNTVIPAPINGVVAKRWALQGDVVQAGQPILSVYSSDRVWVTANFEETKLTGMHPGSPAEIAVDAYPDVKFTGKVIQIGSNTASQFSLIPPNNASGNFTKVTQRVPVKISIDQDPPPAPPARCALLPGMSVEVKVKSE